MDPVKKLFFILLIVTNLILIISTIVVYRRDGDLSEVISSLTVVTCSVVAFTALATQKNKA